MAVMERARVVGGALEAMVGVAGEVMVACYPGCTIDCITSRSSVLTAAMDRAVVHMGRSIMAVADRMAAEPT